MEKQTMQNQQTTDSRNARIQLIAMSGICMFLLTVLMLFSGEKSVNAFSQNQTMVLQNANVEVHRVQILDAYQKQQKVFGLVESASQIDIGFELSGSIDSLNVTEGVYVKQGQVLATIDLKRLNAQKAQLNASLNRAKADAEISQLSVNRVYELVKAKLDSTQNLDQANARLKAADAVVKEVEASISALDVEIQKSKLVAPFNGQVLRQLQDLGSVVSAGQAVFTLVANTQLEARFGLPTHTAFGIEIGQEFVIDTKQMPVSGKVQSIATQRNRAMRTIDTVFSLDNDENPYLMTGDIVSISVTNEVAKKGAWVPVSSLANGVRGLWTLYVAEKVEGGHIVKSRTVAVEYLEEQRAYVTGAIKDGDKIVVNGLQRLTPNQIIAKVNEVSVSLGN
ncbi:efflux transporter, RND family, MFP subunit [Glaciecola sp. KUL10]|nr:efflux transporter, RND family, MFP subunit [Glaciecola sp. KUL10]